MIVKSGISPEEIKVFIAEADEYIQNLDVDIVMLEANCLDPELLQKIFRAAHTLKGSSAMLGHTRMEEVAHAMEGLLDKLSNQKAGINSEIVDTLLAAVDTLKALRNEILLQTESDIDVRPLVCRLNKAKGITAGDKKKDNAMNSRAVLPKKLRRSARAGKQAGSNYEAEGFRTIRVDISELDSFIGIIDELKADNWRINQIGKMLEFKYPEDSLIGDLRNTCEGIDAVMGKLYPEIKKLNNVPINVVFSKFPRFVRDTAQKLHKNVDFVIRGASLEMDRAIVENLQVPLVHLLRNALDHGIETPGERMSKGKPARALLSLSASREAGCVLIKLEDNGCGIDPEEVRQSAVERGVISREAVIKITDREALNLVFLPGVSTCRDTTKVSGRGIGLDIVRTNIERLGGEVTLKSRVGKGSAFVIRLPLAVGDNQPRQNALVFAPDPRMTCVRDMKI